MKKSKPNQTIPKPVLMRVPKRAYQPSRKEQREEIDMPGMSYKETRQAFCRPFKFKTK